MKKIVIDDAVPFAKEIFSHLGEVLCLPGREITKTDLLDADALIVRSRTQVNRSLLEGTKVSFVGSTVVGLDHIDQAYLKNQQIHFYSAQGCNANSVAEFVFAEMLILAEELKFDLADKSLAIIGVGHVGKQLQAKAEAFNMKLYLNDPPRQAKEPENAAIFCDLETALQADIISFHTPLTKDGDFPSYHLLSESRLKNIKANQILINAARGGIIDEQAWFKTKTLANLVDSWEQEPNIDPVLYTKSRIATPHIAGHSLDAKLNGSEMVYQTLCQFWQITPQETWKQNIPNPPEAIKLNDGSLQNQIYQAVTQAHNPIADDAAIRDSEIVKTIKKFEYYRRHYPEYREWRFQKVTTTKDEKVNNLLNRLGFQLV